MTSSVPHSVKVRVVRDNSLASDLIGYFGGGYWAHMAIYVSPGYVIDARDDVVEGVAPGVQKRPAAYLDAYPHWMDIEIPASQLEQAKCYALLEGQIGKPYDKLAIWNFFTGTVYDRNWRDQSAWFCDELDLYALEGAGIIGQVGPLWRSTPGTAAQILMASGGQVTRSKGLPKALQV